VVRARPGAARPAAYGRGGREPTVTDAHVVLGHLPRNVTRRGVQLDRELALEAFGGLARELGSSRCAPRERDRGRQQRDARRLRTLTVAANRSPAMS